MGLSIYELWVVQYQFSDTVNKCQCVALISLTLGTSSMNCRLILVLVILFLSIYVCQKMKASLSLSFALWIGVCHPPSPIATLDESHFQILCFHFKICTFCIIVLCPQILAHWYIVDQWLGVKAVCMLKVVGGSRLPIQFGFDVTQNYPFLSSHSSMVKSRKLNCPESHSLVIDNL